MAINTCKSHVNSPSNGKGNKTCLPTHHRRGQQRQITADKRLRYASPKLPLATSFIRKSLSKIELLINMISQNSPDNKFRLILKEKDEIPWGPVYYSVKIENCRIILWFRIFGENFLWSEDSKYLFLQEWFTIDRKLAPKTGILAVNLVKRKKKLVVKPVKAWSIPKKFDNKNNILEYEVIEYSRDEKFNLITNIEKSSVKIDF